MEDMTLDGCGNKLMDQNEVAEFLGISPKTLEYYRWKKVGPKYLKIGKLARYRKCDVIAFIKALLEVEANKENQD
jgi:predicted DNA-binding transcriptional regulator AlpA